MWSAHRLAALMSERSSASSEARNSATSMALLSRRQAVRREAPGPISPCPAQPDAPAELAPERPEPLRRDCAGRADAWRGLLAASAPTEAGTREYLLAWAGGSVRIRALMKAW